MRVLVTGATTAVGTHLVRALLAAPGCAHVLAVAAGERGELPDHPRLTYLDTDLTRPRAVHDLLFGPARALAIDAVVHGPLHRSARDRGDHVHALNVETSRALILGCEHHPTIQRFVYRSVAEVYAIRSLEPNLIDEDQALEHDPAAPQWVRDRVEADLLACSRMGMSPLSIVVLRCAEVLAPGTGSQLWDYLQSLVCLRPLGFDPMVNLLSLDDCVAALGLALAGRGHGVFNIPGADTLPLSRVAARFGRRDVPVPGPLLAPLYRLRTWTVGFEFRYDLNLKRFHFGGVVDGSRAGRELRYQPRHRLLPGGVAIR